MAVRRLGTIFAPTVATLQLLAIGVLSFYDVDRQAHAANLQSISQGGDELCSDEDSHHALDRRRNPTSSGGDGHVPLMPLSPIQMPMLQVVPTPAAMHQS